MMRRLVASLGLLCVMSPCGPTPVGYAAQEVTATRLSQNPLITVDASLSLGGNVNGPTVIRVPDWIDRPLGRYYMYFANHMGTFIRLAYADVITGPWRVHEPGVLHVRDTAFFRPQPDPKETLADFYTHVASPEVFVDRERKRLLMWFHGWWTNSERWPRGPARGPRVGDEERIRAVYAGCRVHGRRPLHGAPAHHQAQLPADFPTRRLLLRGVADGPACPLQRSARELRDRSESVPRQLARDASSPRRTPASGKPPARLLHGDRRRPRSGS